MKHSRNIKLTLKSYITDFQLFKIYLNIKFNIGAINLSAFLRLNE